jgi:hypothetical protein
MQTNAFEIEKVKIYDIVGWHFPGHEWNKAKAEAASDRE